MSAWTKFEDDLLRKALRDPDTRYHSVVNLFDNRSMGSIAKRATQVEGIPPRTKILIGRGAANDGNFDWGKIRKQTASRDEMFAEAMQGKRFSDAPVPNERRINITKPVQHVPREANS
jgi:hypothetical protein